MSEEHPREAPTRRARSADAKDQRRRQLLEAAGAVLDRGAPLSAITMGDVAEQAGLAKGTTYLYFSSKEALFLEVLLPELHAWLDTLLPALAAGPGSADAVAGTLAGTLAARPRLLRLLGELHSALEATLDVPTARAFKRSLSAALQSADAAAFPHIQGFRPGDFARLLLRTHALLVGLGPMSRPSPAVASVLDEPELRWMRVELEPELRAAIRDWIVGAGR